MIWCDDLAAICQRDVPLREHTWYGLGGPARWFLSPRDTAELGQVLAHCRTHGVPWRVLGHGANVLVRDAGFDGAVIRLTGPAWEAIQIDGQRVRVAAGASFPTLVKRTVEQGLGGLENLAGIPGTLGGAVRMNAGGKYGNIGQYVQGVRVLAPDGDEQARTAAEMHFGYRSSRLDGGVVLETILELTAGEPDALLARFREVWQEKHASQPAVSAKSAGCVFKNPPGQAAGALIDRAGLKGQRRGGAEISTRHANFIVAYAGATAQDVLDLIALAKDRVHENAGIELELEIEVW